MMKVQKKLVKLIIILITSLKVFGFMTIPVLADGENRGGLRINTERIIKGQSENIELRETELERIFPTLFTDETKEMIEKTEQLNKNNLEELEKSIFSQDLDGNTMVEEVKNALFTEEYSVAVSGSNQDEEDASSDGIVSTTILTVFSGLGLLLLVGLYTGMRSLYD